MVMYKQKGQKLLLAILYKKAQNFYFPQNILKYVKSHVSFSLERKRYFAYIGVTLSQSVKDL